jgi:hypothetical protein
LKIIIPKELDLESTLNFCNIIDTNNDGVCAQEEYIYDYKDMSRVEPFGMLLIGSKIRCLVNENEKSVHKDINFKLASGAKSYAAHMGFYQSVYQDFGNKPGEAKGSDTYIPITEIKFSELRKKKVQIYEYIENDSSRIANILSRGDNNLKEYLNFSVRELIRNVLEHSESDSLWYAGQYWKSNGIVEVAILDEGIGIFQSLKKSKKVSVTNSLEAIIFALEPGISKSGIGKEAKDEYDNTGFGLYMISRFCREAGEITICSGGSCIVIENGIIKDYETNFKGTAIRIRLNPKKLLNNKKVTCELSKEGNEIAKNYKKMNSIEMKDIVNI